MSVELVWTIMVSRKCDYSIGGIGSERCPYHCVPSRNGVLGGSSVRVLLVYAVSPEVRNLGCVLKGRELLELTIWIGCRSL